MWKLSQTNLDIKFKLVGGGYSPIYLIIGAITVIYFISVLAGYSILSAFLAFPAVYIAPGLLLILLVSGGRVQVLRQLIILSFFLSTIIAVITISLLMLFNAAIYALFVSLIYLFLNFVLIRLHIPRNLVYCLCHPGLSFHIYATIPSNG
jgi:hypothetical protein